MAGTCVMPYAAALLEDEIDFLDADAIAQSRDLIEDPLRKQRGLGRINGLREEQQPDRIFDFREMRANGLLILI